MVLFNYKYYMASVKSITESMSAMGIYLLFCKKNITIKLDFLSINNVYITVLSDYIPFNILYRTNLTSHFIIFLRTDVRLTAIQSFQSLYPSFECWHTISIILTSWNFVQQDMLRGYSCRMLNWHLELNWLCWCFGSSKKLTEFIMKMERKSFIIENYSVSSQKKKKRKKYLNEFVSLLQNYLCIIINNFTATVAIGIVMVFHYYWSYLSLKLLRLLLTFLRLALILLYSCQHFV